MMIAWEIGLEEIHGQANQNLLLSEKKKKKKTRIFKGI